jgi:hypothetical protein
MSMVQHLTEAYESGYATGRRLAEKMIWQATLSDRLLKDPGYRPGHDCHAAYQQGFFQALEDSANMAARSRARKGSAKNRERPSSPEGTRPGDGDTRHHHKFWSQPSGARVARKRGAEVILEDVVRLIDQLDDTELKEGQDLPFLELAKAASVVRPLPSRSNDSPG